MAADVSEEKIIGLDGKPIIHTPNSEPKVYEVFEMLRQELDGEKQVAIGFVVVDHLGRVATNFYWKAGNAHGAMSGAALLLKRMQDRYEENLTDPLPAKPIGA